MNWFLLTTIAILARATYSVAAKVLSGRAHSSPMAQSILLTGGAAILTLAASPWLGGLSFAGLGEVWLVAVAMVVSQAFGNVLFFKGQAKLDASVAQIAFSSILLWSVLLSVTFLGSTFTLRQSAGIALLLVAILMAQYRKGKKRIQPAVLYIAASTLFFAIFQVMSAELAKTLSAGTYLLLAYGGSTLIVAAVYSQRVDRDLTSLKPRSMKVLQAMVFAASSSLVYFAAAYYAYREAPDPGVVVLLLTTQVVISVILGAIFLRERERLGGKLAAGALAVVAGLLIKS